MEEDERGRLAVVGVLLAQQIAFVSRLTLMVSAPVMVATSLALAWTCGQIAGVHQIANSRVVFGVEPATAFGILCVVLAAYKPVVGIVLAAADVQRGPKYILAILWLLLVLFNWSINVPCLVNDISKGAGIVAAVLIIEILSGSLPGVLYVINQPPPSIGTPSPLAALAPTSEAASSVKPASTPKFADVQAFVRHVQEQGSDQFPGVRLNSDGSLLAGQRTYARNLGIPLATCNARLWDEHRAGRLHVTCSRRGTRITLPQSHAS